MSRTPPRPQQHEPPTLTRPRGDGDRTRATHSDAGHAIEPAATTAESHVTVLGPHPPVDPVAAYLATLAPKSRQVVRERLQAVARAIGVDPTTLPWHELRAHHVDAIRGRLLELGRAPATVNLTLAALRGVLKQARNQHLLTDEEYRRITEVKPARGSRLPAGRDVAAGELRAMVEACARDQGAAGRRDLAILAVLYIGGLRRSELVALEVADYRAEPPTLRVRHGGGRAAGMIPSHLAIALRVRCGKGTSTAHRHD